MRQGWSRFLPPGSDLAADAGIATTSAASSDRVSQRERQPRGRERWSVRAERGLPDPLRVRREVQTADGSDGYAVVRFESGGRSYRIRSDDVDSIGALGPLVDFRATRWTGSARSKQALNGGRLDVR
jgi:hypothetical protein